MLGDAYPYTAYSTGLTVTFPGWALDGGRDAILAEGIRCYKSFINGLLDITDNLDRDAVLPPADVVRSERAKPVMLLSIESISRDAARAGVVSCATV